MDKIIPYLFLFLLPACIATKKNTLQNSLSTVNIENENLYAVLDSIVSHEHRCKYYTPDLLFTIFFTNNQSILIGSIETRIIQSGRELGCFYYKDHLFIVKGENQDTTLFSPTTKKVNNIFSESKTGYNKKTDTWFLDVDAIQDDSYFYWYYWYKDEEFIFDTKSTYCDEK